MYILIGMYIALINLTYWTLYSAYKMGKYQPWKEKFYLSRKDGWEEYFWVPVFLNGAVFSIILWAGWPLVIPATVLYKVGSHARNKA